MRGGCFYTGLTGYTQTVLRALLRRPMHVPALMAETHLRRRTVLAQIDFLRKAEAITVCHRMKRHNGSGGRWHVYQPVVIEL